MKYIIRRIIVGVGIALVMMFLTRTFSLKVYAATTFYVAPNELRIAFNNGSSTSTMTYSSLHTIEPPEYPYNTFYGRNLFVSGYTMYQQLYRVEVPTNYKSGYYDINFVYYNKFLNSGILNQYSFNLRNSSRTFTCTSDNISSFSIAGKVGNNNSYYTGAPKNFIGVKCENVYLELNNNNVVYAVIDSSSTSAGDDTPYGISALTFQQNDSNDKIIANQQTIIQKEQEQTQAIQDNTQAQQDTNDILNDDDTTDAQNSGSSFFNNFSSTDHGGLSGIITAPLVYIQQLASGYQCTPLEIPLPFMQQPATLPCISRVISSMQGGNTLLFNYRMITEGIIAYWVLVKLFAHIRSFKKPDEDRVEVLEL